MEKGIEIEICGHKAKISSVSARQADGIFYKEDSLMVSIYFDGAVDGVDGFAVHLPVERYSRSAFLSRVKAEADATLPKLLEKHRQEGEERRRQKEKQEALDLVAGEIKSEIGLA